MSKDTKQLEDEINKLKAEVQQLKQSQEHRKKSPKKPTKEENLVALKENRIEPDVIAAFLALFNITAHDFWLENGNNNNNYILRILNGTLTLSDSYKEVITESFRNLVNEVSKPSNFAKNTYNTIDDKEAKADIKTAFKVIRLLMEAQKEYATPKERDAIDTYLSFLQKNVKD
ncbi:hypothetical protein [Succinivibrio dextrinosolvens]|uniref:hypothetical protein n=1 Tax=Succinivibrio dextrinosolvens TaxID=83771 RepID=UPI0019225C97|nr:hypothetical protein [Succinivibrio dextrinosolvens]